MQTIHLLDESLINKIAAGEVVDRPASAVKELLENSLDAFSTSISIEIEKAGKKKIRIVDNGRGMSNEDAALCWKRHATSKIKNEDDLNRIGSFGFRGEALASIAEISSLTLTAKQKDDVSGTRLVIEGGKLVSEEVCAAPDGTIIEINDLFFNVPARKKFLKSDSVEFGHIVTVVTKYALANPKVAVRLTHNDSIVLDSPATKDALENIASIYGTEFAEQLLGVEYSDENVTVRGYVGRPSLTRADATDQSLFINGRYVKNKYIGEAVRDGFGTLMFTNRQPVFVIDIEIEPELIDVNVHPQKTFVRFRQEYLVKQAVEAAVRLTLEQHNLITKVSVDPETSQKAVHSYEFSKDRQSVLEVESDEDTSNSLYGSTDMASDSSEKGVVRDSAAVSRDSLLRPTGSGDIKERRSGHEKSFGPFYVLGQFNRTYIVCESPDGLVLFDQHAVEERINYEKFKREKVKGAIKKQSLISSRVIEVTPRQYATARKFKDYLSSIGFDVEVFGETSVKVFSVPQIFDRFKDDLLLDLLNQLGDVEDDVVSQEIEERITRFSCRSSVKAGEELTSVQMRALIDGLLLCENPYSCPHGRPTMILMTVADLEKKFKRVV